MTVQELIDAWELPDSCRVGQRIPKKLLLEHGAQTATDKRSLTEGIEEIHWVYTLKPTSVGVPAYRDENREYLEIALLHIVLRPDAKIARIAELTHRAVPYPLLLLLSTPEQLTLSMAHIRWAQNEAGKMVLEDGYPQMSQMDADKGKDKHNDLSGVHLRKSASSADKSFLDNLCESTDDAFLASLALKHQPRENLHVLYQGWLDTLAAFQAAQMTGAFVQYQTREQLAARRASLFVCRELEQQITTLRTTASKEKQLARQVALNLEIQQLQAKLQQARADL